VNPPPNCRDPASQAAALATLEPFARRLLPGVLRRLSAWRGLTVAGREDLAAELLQELRLDCLEQPATIVELTPRERHQRWFRLVARWVYRQRRRGDAVRDEPVEPSRAPDFEPTPAELRRLLPGLEPDLVAGLVKNAQRHRNGRYNLSATAGRLGMRSAGLRRLWENVADRLGYGSEFLSFWRRRLAEALTGLAADLLRDSGCLWLWPARRSPPDPRGRLRRIRRIHALLHSRPLPPEIRHAFGPLLRRSQPDLLPARELLGVAAELAPEWAAIPLWTFEAAVLDGELPAAARALRRGRALGADPVAVVLARARLLEARGRLAAAAALVRRAAARGRCRDRRLRSLSRELGRGKEPPAAG
jgi:hypothetical protein